MLVYKLTIGKYMYISKVKVKKEQHFSIKIIAIILISVTVIAFIKKDNSLMIFTINSFSFDRFIDILVRISVELITTEVNIM